MIAVYIISAFFVLQILLVWNFIKVGRSNQSKGGGNPIKAISIIIPFKNEALRIGALLDSINEVEMADGLEVEFIFIDDNSTDDTKGLIEAELKVSYTLLKNNGKGKKDAIDFGIRNAKYDFILSWDADINVRSSYLVEIAALPECDMWILPVKMVGERLIQGLGVIEFSWLQILTFRQAQLRKASLCNGANLLFRKSAYNEFTSNREDIGILSGDDHFLLKSLSTNDKDIRAFYSKKVEVETEAPDSFKGLLNQRKRWSSKLDGSDSRAFVIAIIALLVLSFASLFTFVALDGEPLVLLMFGSKFIADYLTMRLYLARSIRAHETLALIFHQFWYPIYLLVLLIHQPKDEKWSV